MNWTKRKYVAKKSFGSLFQPGDVIVMEVDRYEQDTVIVKARTPEDYDFPPYFEEVVANKGTIKHAYTYVEQSGMPLFGTEWQSSVDSNYIHNE